MTNLQEWLQRMIDQTTGRDAYYIGKQDGFRSVLLHITLDETAIDATQEDEIAQLRTENEALKAQVLFSEEARGVLVAFKKDLETLLNGYAEKQDMLTDWAKSEITTTTKYMGQFANRQDTGALTLEAKAKGQLLILEEVLKRLSA